MTAGPDGDPRPDTDATTRIPRVGAVDEDAPTGPIPVVPAASPPSDAGSTGPTRRIDPVEDEQPERGERSSPTLMEQMGGVQGIVASTVPVAVFVIVNLLFSLQPALIAAIAAGVVVAIVRVARRQALQPAVSGLVGVGVCAFIAYRTGEARGFYLPGLLYSAGLGLAFLVSIIVRWPLAGVIWHGINGHGQGWRRNPRMLAAYSWASALWVFVFAARLVVQGWLYNADEETWLGIARLAMGYPLVGVAIVGTVLLVRRAESSAKV
ncbi:DUF3159 domain-containing protein [Pseudonocardia oroxyli]|uniref:DUF3159 domain-containing protein n=1 Tax=Pseudonocardia oroxyli TaxID=366584 RepID=A0A1G7YMX8_PSEOR|nr:DUF3159 domain-containing protein [Pseudonocardia oroxyli]SDG97665.1 Protein of unknown function [Pseudonocardia oroxyli]